MNLIACPALNQSSKHLKYLAIYLLVIVLGIFSVPKPILAQTETQVLSQELPANLTGEFGLNGLKTDYVWTKESLATEIAAQRKIYRDQLVIYRQQEKNFLIAQDQYRRHETLDAIEQAVKATRQVLLSRDQVLHTYLTLLQLRLMESEGIEISLKTELLNKLEVVREKLKVHHASAIDQLDRPTANKLSDQFTTIGEEAELLGSQVLGLLSLGKLQEIFDKSMALSPDITAEVTVTSADKSISAETTRSLRETAASLVVAKNSLDLSWEKVAERVMSDADISGQSDFSQELNASYANLSKSLGYFLELLKLYRTVGAAATCLFMLDNQNPDLDQTQFGSEGWLFAANKNAPQVVDPSVVPQPVWWQTKNGKIVLIGIAAFLMLSLVLVGASLNRTNQKLIEEELVEEDSGAEIDLGPLGLKARNLRDQLKLADPTKELDPYPPVKIDLRLDKDTN